MPYDAIAPIAPVTRWVPTVPVHLRRSEATPSDQERSNRDPQRPFQVPVDRTRGTKVDLLA